ncbi:MAG: cobalt-precorrin-6A reductase [Sedimentitalea sp.]
MRPNLLILGGTTEATALAQALDAAAIAGTFSYAGRVARPKRQPLPTRVGGFGGVAGLLDYLRTHAISHVVDATHPFAAGMSRNAALACAEAGVPLVALSRPAWDAQSGDKWRRVGDIPSAVTALGTTPRRVMLAIGRMHLGEFAPAPQHFYLLRLVDAPDVAPPLPLAEIVVDQGPFTVANDRALMEKHRIDIVVSKNAGGTASRAKIDAARGLGLEVVMIDRPALPERTEMHRIEDVIAWCAHSGTDLGV